MIGDDEDHEIRTLREEDLEAVAGFEVDIARVSFGDEAITDPSFHKKRLERYIGDGGALVAEDPSGKIVGWALITPRKNASTNDRYGDFRSLFVSEGHRGGRLAFQLMSTVVDYARKCEFSRIAGRTGAENTPMQSIYRYFGFEPRHISFELPLWDSKPVPRRQDPVPRAKTGGDAVPTRRRGAQKPSRRSKGSRRT